ncbi:MAG: hypothetical protein ABIU54_12735 [Candidatus Eisenbacteria bacterium]
MSGKSAEGLDRFGSGTAALFSLLALALISSTFAPIHAVKSDSFRADREQRARVGTACSLHPWVRLRADTVAIRYGFLGSELSAEMPGYFINSRLEVSGGCVMGKPYTEVAYCTQCRSVRQKWTRARGR